MFLCSLAKRKCFLLNSLHSLHSLHGDLFFIVKVLTDYATYDDHYQTCLVDNGYERDTDCLKCLNSNDLKLSLVSFLTSNGNGELCFSKHWI